MDTEKKRTSFDQLTPITKEELTIGSQMVTREKMMIEGQPVKVTTMVVDHQPVALVFDDELVKTGIVTEPNSLLIDQQTTSALLPNQRRAGFTPQEYIAHEAKDVLVIPGNHFGWQEGAFLINQGELVLIANDQLSLVGIFDTLVCIDGHWGVISLELEAGEVSEEDSHKLEKVTVGMSGPQIVHDGEVVPLEHILDDPRIKADMRNLVDISAGRAVSANFFQAIRKINAGTLGQLQRLVRRDPSSVVIKAPIPNNPDDQAALTGLKNEIEEQQLSHLKMDTKGSDYRLGIFGKLPEQKIPLIAYGCDEQGRLIVVAVDGRQEESVGVTISQMARLIKEKGATNAILGCGGGDVAVVAKINGDTKVINQPSTVGENGNSITRRVPSLIKIEV